MVCQIEHNAVLRHKAPRITILALTASDPAPFDAAWSLSSDATVPRMPSVPSGTATASVAAAAGAQSGEVTTVFSVGDAVALHGLQARPELNAQAGTLQSFDASTGRWGVRLSGLPDPLSIKPSNLRLLASASAMAAAATVQTDRDTSHVAQNAHAPWQWTVSDNISSAFLPAPSAEATAGPSFGVQNVTANSSPYADLLARLERVCALVQVAAQMVPAIASASTNVASSSSSVANVGPSKAAGGSVSEIGLTGEVEVHPVDDVVRRVAVPWMETSA